MLQILIIDDEPANLMLFSSMLKATGYQVTSSHDPYEGLELACSTQPDICIVDYRLPRMDGLTVIKALRASPITEHIATILITADLITEIKSQAEKAGCNAILQTPISRSHFINVIEQLYPTSFDED